MLILNPSVKVSRVSSLPPPCSHFCLITSPRLKGALEKEEQESEVIKDSPDSPEPLNKKPRLAIEEVQPSEKAKGNPDVKDTCCSRFKTV